jgi:hypothetical protein
MTLKMWSNLMWVLRILPAPSLSIPSFWDMTRHQCAINVRRFGSTLRLRNGVLRIREICGYKIYQKRKFRKYRVPRVKV